MKGLVLGLSTGGFCLGACAPAMLPYLISSGNGNARSSLSALGEFLAGRLTAYIILAGLIVPFGARIQAMPLGGKVTAVLMGLLAIMLIAHGFSVNFPESKTCGILKRSAVLSRFPFAAGLILGVNACPPLMMAFAYMLTLGRWGSGIGFSVAFFAGTTVYLLPLALSGHLGKLLSVRGLAEVAAIFSGFWFLAQGVSLWLHT